MKLLLEVRPDTAVRVAEDLFQKTSVIRRITVDARGTMLIESGRNVDQRWATLADLVDLHPELKALPARLEPGTELLPAASGDHRWIEFRQDPRDAGQSRPVRPVHARAGLWKPGVV